jgi:UDP-N-acetylglucosamine 2-epimerase (non-hydrolysing)
VAQALQAVDSHVGAHPPAVVVVQGDTNSALAGALAANGRDIPLVHVEAGLRSYDRAMPEEHNRVLIDHLAERLCAPTVDNVANLAAEGITTGVKLTGNTVVEAVAGTLPDTTARRAILARYDVQPDRYVVATIHRPENTDDPERLASILHGLGRLELPVLVPLHPRTRQAATDHDVTPLLDGLRVVDPLPAAAFLSLCAHAALLVSDSGGLQEECTILKRPLVVVRRSTERPESTPDFATVVEPDAMLATALDVVGDLSDLDARLARLGTLPSPYGDGRASQRIATCIEHLRHGGP